MTFDAHVRDIFENNETKFVAFNKLMLDASVNKYEEGIDAKTANEKIQKVFRQAIGVSENASKQDVRKAMKIDYFDDAALIAEHTEKYKK